MLLVSYNKKVLSFLVPNSLVKKTAVCIFRKGRTAGRRVPVRVPPRLSSMYFVYESAGRCERGRQRVRRMFSSQTEPNVEQAHRAADVG